MVGPKKQDFWPKISILKGNHCILKIQGVSVRQKLGMTLENKVVQKLKVEKNVSYKIDTYSQMIFLLKKFRRFFNVEN